MTVHTARLFNPAEFRLPYLKPVLDLWWFVNEHMKPYLSHAFIHGSIADGTYKVGWSDLDTLFVLRPGVDMGKYKSLEQDATVYLDRIDPLHHHGFIYGNIPGVVIDHAVSLIVGAESIDIRDRGRQEALEALKERRYWLERAVETGVYEHHAYQGEYLKARWQNADNAMYQLKYLLEGVMLLPALLLEIQGEPTYKGESFAKVDLSGYPILTATSTVRDMWPQCEQHPYQGNAVPWWVQAIVGDNYLEEALEITDAALDMAKAVAA